MLRRTLLCALIAVSCALTARPTGAATIRGHVLSSATIRGHVRAPRSVLMQDGGDGGEKLSEETLINTAAAATGDPPMSWPEANPTPVAPDDTSVGPSEGFDPRVILYVSLPALVLIGQLFFTFSRDALGDVALGPAMMD